MMKGTKDHRDEVRDEGSSVGEKVEEQRQNLLGNTHNVNPDWSIRSPCRVEF